MKIKFFMAVETIDDSYSNGTCAETIMADAKQLFAETGKSIKLRVCVEVDGEIHFGPDGASSEFEVVLIDAATK